jgi:hypothetical protein
MSNPALELCAAAAFVAAAPALAQAQNISYPVKSPIAITAFHVNELYTPGTIGTDVEQAPQFVATDVSVKFVNTGNVAAKVVKFSVNAGQSTQTIVDKGTFTAGAQIRHDFAIADHIDAPNATCNVTEVTFADGSVWRAGPGIASR